MMANGAGFIPVVFLALSIILGRAARVFIAGGEPALGHAVDRVGWFFLIAGAVAFAAVWSRL